MLRALKLQNLTSTFVGFAVWTLYGTTASAQNNGYHPQTWLNAGVHGQNGNLVADINGDQYADIIALNANSVTAWTASCCAYSPVGTVLNYGFSGTRGNFLVKVGGGVAGGKVAAYNSLVGVGNNYIGVAVNTQQNFGYYAYAQFWPKAGESNPPALPTGSVYMADMNNDGFSDVIINNPNATYEMQCICKENPPASAPNYFTDPVLVSSFTFQGNHGNVISDINGDGYADLVGFGQDYIGVLYNSANGFQPYQTYANFGFFGNGTALFVGHNGSNPGSATLFDSHFNAIGLANGYVGDLLHGSPPVYDQTLNESFIGDYGTFLADANGDKVDDLIEINNENVVVAYGDATL